jgi:hypothetical protein
MFELLIYLIASSVIFIAGFYAGVKNADSSKVNAGKELLRRFKSKD